MESTKLIVYWKILKDANRIFKITHKYFSLLKMIRILRIHMGYYLLINWNFLLKINSFSVVSHTQLTLLQYLRNFIIIQVLFLIFKKFKLINQMMRHLWPLLNSIWVKK